MWTSAAIARRSASSSHRTASHIRHLSSRDQSGGGRGGRGGGRGGGDRRQGTGRGRGALNRFTNRNAQKQAGGRPHRGGPRKENFAKTFLEPAARGQLKKHESGIPKLAARKKKSHTRHDQYPGREADQVLEEEGMMGPGDTRYSGGSSVKVTYRAPVVSLQDYFPSQDEDGYDSEDDFDDAFDKSEMIDLESNPNVSTDEEGFTVLEYDSDDDEEDGGREQQGRPQMRRDDEEQANLVDPEEDFFYRDIGNLDEDVPYIPPHIANRSMPLNVQGDELDDFLEAMLMHPTKYAEVKRYNPHPESLRRGKPIIPKGRLQPSTEFVRGHKRFLFVSGLPHHVDENGEVGELENPLHCHEVVKMVANLFDGVKSEQVSPASMTSAFIGFKDKADRQKALRDGPKQKTFSSPVLISKYDGNDHADFAKDAAVVQLENLPATMTVAQVARELFPVDTELGSLYGTLSADKVLKTSTTSALVKLESKEQAESALSSAMVQRRLEELGEFRVRYFKAKRERIHGGFTGPNKAHAYDIQSDRLMVSGDAPSDDFFRCHTSVVQVRNIDPSMTKKKLSKHFQPFSASVRDVTGSIEFVTCQEGLQTDRAFVGFDRPGEAEALLKSCSGLLRVGKKTATVRLVKEKYVPRSVKPDTRSERTEEELMGSLHNWQDYVDSKDIEELEEMGIIRAREVLADAFHSMRFHNHTYGALDWSMTREKLTPERQDPGDHIRETMKLYVETLKECIATPENPGPVYEGLFMPGEEVDLSIFDREKQRQADLRKKATGME